MSLRNCVFQQCVEKECVLDPVCFPDSLGGFAHENEDQIPIMIRCEVGADMVQNSPDRRLSSKAL